MQDSVKWIFLKTRHFLTKACKGIQYSGKLYTATMKPLPLKWIPSQVPLKKMPNFNNNLNYSTFFSWLLFIFSFLHAEVIIWKCYLLLKKCLKDLCSFLLKNGITRNCLWWRIIVWCISHASGKVLLRVVEFYW